ncbi:hypothetical protein GCM10010486_01130 [Nonomuraea roseoviolacea subsp. carminata]
MVPDLGSVPSYEHAPRVICMSAIIEFHGLHVAPSNEFCVRIQWHDATNRASRVRVRAHTCLCTSPSYELCQSGGLLFIRRTTRGPGRRAIHESPWQVRAEGMRLWELLVEGLAR